MSDTLMRFPNESFSGADMVATITFSGPDNKAYQRVLGELQTISYSIHMEKRPVRSIGNVNAKDFVIGPRTIAGSLVFAVFNKHFAQDIMKETNNKYKTNTTFLVDELPPFDITISFANEYGIRSRLVIYGVRLLTEGQVMSINDVYTENTYQYFATDIEYLNDEASFSRDINSGLYMITGENIKYQKTSNPILTTGAKENRYPHIIQNTTITLGVQTKNQTKPNRKGLAEFMLYPKQSFGDIIITNEYKEEIVLKIRNANTHVHQIELDPGSYMAYFIDKDRKSNTVSFIIAPYVIKNNMVKYAPVIESVSDTMIALYSNEPTHTHVKVASIVNNNVGEYTYYDINNRKAIIKDLQKDTQYSLATCSGPNTISSPNIYVKTLNAYDHNFSQLKKFIEANSNLLRIKTLDDYYAIVELAKNKANSLDIYKSPSDLISLVKADYEKKIKDINTKDDNALILQQDYEYRITLCLELIFITTKIRNDNITAINKNNNQIDIPTHALDDSCNDIITFSSNTTCAEFFKLTRNFTQLVATVPSYNFREIDNVPNSFRFLGKQGSNHYAYGLDGAARSAKLEFYIMTEPEKQEYLNNIKNENVLSKEQIANINANISDRMPEVNNAPSSANRAFLYEAKKNEDAYLPPPHIESISEKEIVVMPGINNLIAKESFKEFYLAIACKKEIENNDMIYKIKFNNTDNQVIIDYLDHGIKNGEQYVLWIEDINKTQISNVITFTCANGKDIVDDTIKEYELKTFISHIRYILLNSLSDKDLDFVMSYVSNNEEVTSNNIMVKILEALGQLLLPMNEFLNVLRELKNYIGITGTINNNTITNTSYNGSNVNFICNEDNTSLIIYSLSKVGILESYSIKTSLLNDIELKNYNGDYLIMLVVNNDFKHKSNIMFIDKIRWQMEVI